MNPSRFNLALLPLVTLISSVTLCVSTENQTQQHDYYTVKPGKLGVDVFGIKLNDPVPQDVIDQIKKDVHTHRIMIFRDQGKVTGKRQVQISNWFGELDAPFIRHPMSPERVVLRLSNDDSEGFVGIGQDGWHIDGSYLPTPYPYALYHMYHVPTKADTATEFAPNREVIEGLSEEQRQRWERIWLSYRSPTKSIHPLVYSHPTTGDKTLCFHTSPSTIKLAIWDYGSPTARVTNQAETNAILREIYNEITKDGDIQYSHKWRDGDFIISDNLAVTHRAGEGANRPRNEIGLRVLHRTTILGTRRPTKNYDVSRPTLKESTPTPMPMPMPLPGKEEL